MKTSTIADLRQIVKQLKAINNPNNNELIALYERKIAEASVQAIKNYFKNR